MSPEVRRMLYVSSNPERDPQGFLNELNRALALVMDQLDQIYGHRDQPRFYSDVNLQEQQIEYAGRDYLRRNRMSGALEFYDAETKTWQQVTAKNLINTLMSQLGKTTLTLSGDGITQTLTGSASELRFASQAGKFGFIAQSDSDIEIGFYGDASDGKISWVTGDDRFFCADDIMMDGAERVYFRNTQQSIYSSQDSYLRIDAETCVELSISGTTVLRAVASSLRPASDGGLDLGAEALRFGNGHFSGTVRANTLHINTGGMGANGTGIGTVKMATNNNANSAIWIPIRYSGSTYYVPGWSTHSP